MLVKMLKRRETLGSTGIGQQVAIPHCRSLVVTRLRCAFGRSMKGIDFKAIDDKPVLYFFLIVAPPLEVSNQYLPVLGKIAQFAKEPDVTSRLGQLKTPAEFLSLLEEKNIYLHRTSPSLTAGAIGVEPTKLAHVRGVGGWLTVAVQPSGVTAVVRPTCPG